jgi:RimJ/RimL family protein N-acetyltransferase
MKIKLRPWSEKDIPNLVRYANNRNIAKWLTDAFPHPYGEKEARGFLEMIKNNKSAQVFAIEMDGEAIGSIGVHPQSDIYRLNAELGYWLAESFWGRGIMVEAVNMIVDWTWKNLDVTRIYAIPFADNVNSARVLDKVGFAKEAVIKDSLIKDGVIQDQIIYSIRRP